MREGLGKLLQSPFSPTKAMFLHEEEGEALEAGANPCLPPCKGPAAFAAIPGF